MTKSLVYNTIIILWILFQLPTEINCQPNFKPKQRQWHTATFVGDKLYILDGVYLSNTTVNVNEFFYLDASISFNAKNPLWQNLPTSIVPAHDNAASAAGGTNNNTIFIFGGYTLNAYAAELVYTFDTQSRIWNAPIIATTNTIVRKQALTGVMDNRGKMYLLGGSTTNVLTDLNDMVILDKINLSWGVGTLTDAPSPRMHYGAVLLPNQNIIMYIGE